MMIKLTDSREKYVKDLGRLTNEGLFHAMIDARIPDDYEGAYTSNACWKANASYKEYVARMGYMLNKDDLV